MSRGRRALVGAAAAFGLACAQAGPKPSEPAESPRPEAGEPTTPARLVLVSVEGLTAERYREIPGRAVDMPRLAAAARTGVSADAVRSVAPAARYPAHATLVTGRLPAHHGIVAERLLDEKGVRLTSYQDADLLRVPTLWGLASRAGLRVATLAWPSTVGASLAQNVPDVEPDEPGETWLGLLAVVTPPAMLARVQQAGGREAPAQRAGRARDAVLARVACSMLASASPPQLLLLRLGQTAPVLAAFGPDGAEARAAFAAVDAEIGRLQGCVRERGLQPSTAFAVVGDHGVLPVHTLVSPNTALAAAGLLTPRQVGQDLVGWEAIARSNGGSAFVYARSSRDALLARRALETLADGTRAFRVVSAEEMLELGADPEAWFGLEAAPGYAFSDAVRAPLLQPSFGRAGWGHLPERVEMDAGFVAWGPGLRERVRVPAMRQEDVAPTLAPLLGLPLEEPDGRALVGVLDLPWGLVLPVPEAPGS
jgi:hypothetical protein